MSASDAEVRAIKQRWPHASIAHVGLFGSVTRVTICGLDIDAVRIHGGAAWKATAGTSAAPPGGAECRLVAEAQDARLWVAIRKVLADLRRFRPSVLACIDSISAEAVAVPMDDDGEGGAQ